jgi:hypothetical protein
MFLIGVTVLGMIPLAGRGIVDPTFLLAGIILSFVLLVVLIIRSGLRFAMRAILDGLKVEERKEAVRETKADYGKRG